MEIEYKFHKVHHKTPVLGIDLKIQNKIMSSPKEQPGDNQENDEISYVRMGHLLVPFYHMPEHPWNWDVDH